MSSISHTECTLSQILKGPDFDKQFDSASGIHEEDCRLNILCLLRAHCISYLNKEISGSAVCLLILIMREFDEINSNSDTKNKIDILKQQSGI